MIEALRHVVEEADRLVPEMVGGFVGYWIHSLHHRVFHWIGHLLPKGLGGAA